MSDPLAPNYTPGIGRLTTDRFDFEAHITGSGFRQTASTVDVVPTITIDGYPTIHTLQDAVNILAQISNPIIPVASTSTLGVVKLSTFGDVQGNANLLRVVNIQGIPISSTSPVNGDVLTFNGTSWIPALPTTSFTANGDLAGSNVSQTITGITGSAIGDSGILNIHCRALVWDIVTNSGHPLLLTAYPTNTDYGNDIWIQAQSTTAAGLSGGRARLVAGSGGAGGAPGNAAIVQADGTPSIQVSNPSSTQRVSALAMHEDLTNSFMPTATGSDVVFIRDATANPTTGVPAGGTILYSSSTDGKLRVKQKDGNDFAVGSTPNPDSWGNTNTLTPTFTSGGQVYEVRAAISSAIGTPTTIFTVALPDLTATHVDVVMVGHYSSANTGAAPSGGLSAQYHLTMGYERFSSAPSAVGTLTSTDPRSMSGTTWTVGSIGVSSNNLVITTGAASTAIIDWTARIKLTFAS